MTSSWLCQTLTPTTREPGQTVYRSTCNGVGTGTGWFEAYIGHNAYQIEYRCSSYVVTGVGPSGDSVAGSSCIAA